VDAGKLSGTVTLESLISAGLVSKARDGVKILGMGELTSALQFEVAAASKSALAAIEKAGGSVKLLVAESLETAAE
jgi:large subunit ribosomal protein L15